MRLQHRRTASVVAASLLATLTLMFAPMPAAATTKILGSPDMTTYSQPAFIGHEETESEINTTECTRLPLSRLFRLPTRSAVNHSSHRVVFYLEKAQQTGLCVGPVGEVEPHGSAGVIGGAHFYQVIPISTHENAAAPH